MDPEHVVNIDELYIKRLRLGCSRTNIKFNLTPKAVSEIDWYKLGFASLVEMKAESSVQVSPTIYFIQIIITINNYLHYLYEHF